MAVLRPMPFAALVRRMLTELERERAVFDLPERAFFPGDSEVDLSVRFHGRRASSPFGPAAGPQSQMAQNLVLSWLGGGRIHELKTVQIRDELEIPRPCIDARTIGYNVEWSQELKLEESLEEYVKGAMLVEILKASGKIALAEGFGDTLWDMSVGYDLEGIRGERVQAFLRGMQDASTVVERLRREIPAEHRRFRDFDFPARLSGTLTLSTFHGCPPDEIERIIDFLLREHRLHCIVKLNPMLLGPETVRGLLHDELGYDDIAVPDSAFERDTKWEQMEGFVERLGRTAESLGLGFGVKFSNTLIVENHGDFLPAGDGEMYLSGQPLHVLAMHLVRRFRDRFGTRYPVSFAAGIDKGNFADAVALGLVPVTVCTDMLRPGGYARGRLYMKELVRRMREVGAATVDAFVTDAYGHGDEARRRAAAAGGDARRVVEEAALLNTATYLERLADDPRYRKAANAKLPKKIGRHLRLFDCITCDKCVPVCPNDANFTFDLPREEIPVVRLHPAEDGWSVERGDPLRIEERHQIGSFADFCNDCGNCDVFCPEDGGPYAVKPRFFGTVAAWEADGRDGFWIGRAGGRDVVLGRFDGAAYRVERDGAGRARFEGPDFAVELAEGDPESTARGRAGGPVDLTYFRILLRVRAAVLRREGTTWPTATSA